MWDFNFGNYFHIGYEYFSLSKLDPEFYYCSRIQAWEKKRLDPDVRIAASSDPKM